MGHMYVRCTSPTLLPLCVCVCAPREEVSRGEGQRMDALSQVAEQLGRPTEEVCLHLLVCVCGVCVCVCVCVVCVCACVCACVCVLRAGVVGAWATCM